METRTRIVGIIIRKGKLLMLKGKGYEELWTSGGKIESGENEEDCLRRELREEVGVELKNMVFFKEYSGVSYYNKNKTINQRVYLVSIEGKIKPAAEIEDCIWLTKKDLEKQKYKLLPKTEKEIIPDLIREEIF